MLTEILLSCLCLCSVAHLSEQEGDGSEGEGPAVLVAEVELTAPGPVEHLIVDAGDVQNQAHHQRQA